MVFLILTNDTPSGARFQACGPSTVSDLINSLQVLNMVCYLGQPYMEWVVGKGITIYFPPVDPTLPGLSA